MSGSSSLSVPPNTGAPRVISHTYTHSGSLNIVISSLNDASADDGARVATASASSTPSLALPVSHTQGQPTSVLDTLEEQALPFYQYSDPGSPSTLNVGSSDVRWEEKRHPNGWTYLWNPLYRMTADRPLQSFNFPKPHLEETEEIYWEREGELIIINHAKQIRYPPGLSSLEVRRRYSMSMDAEAELVAKERYWHYMEKHPAHLQDGVGGKTFSYLNNARNEALAYLNWCSLEALIPSSSPTASLSLQQCQGLLATLSTPSWGRFLSSQTDSDTVMILAISRILVHKYEMHLSFSFWSQNHQMFLSEFHKRDDDNQRLHPSIFHYIIYAPFFWAPIRYTRYIASLDTSFLQTDQWKGHLQALVKEWTDINLLATVMLASGVSMLSVNQLGSTATTALLISTLCALASLVTGVYCAIAYQPHTPDLRLPADAREDANRYKRNMNTSLSLQIIAFILSLPIVLLLWSAIAFTVAIIGFTASTNDSLFRGPLIGAAAAVAVMVIAIFGVILALAYIWKTRTLKGRISSAAKSLNLTVRRFSGRRKVHDGEKSIV